VENHAEDVLSAHEKETFQQLFWEQQNRANSLGSSKSMCWHLLIIKWCLFWHLSGNKAYELLHDSGCIKLPLQCTLKDYTHYIKRQVGFSSDVDHAIVNTADLSNYLHKNVILEIYIKMTFMTNTKEHCRVGFVDIGDIKNQILDFQDRVTNREHN